MVWWMPKTVAALEREAFGGPKAELLLLTLKMAACDGVREPAVQFMSARDLLAGRSDELTELTTEAEVAEYQRPVVAQGEEEVP
jgi:hypothetical protein